MIYMKTPTGKEVPVPEFFEFYVDMQGDFDEYSTLYCDECSRKVIEQQQRGN